MDCMHPADRLPEELPVLALREFVAFPYMVLPLFVERERSIAAIEEATERKVLDRSELILDIFAGRATTHEAKLQVEIAQLEAFRDEIRAHVRGLKGAFRGNLDYWEDEG